MSNVVLENVSTSEKLLNLSFNRVLGNVASVNVYISLTNVIGNYVVVKKKIPNIPVRPNGDDRVPFVITLDEVQALLPEVTWSSVSFLNTPLYVLGTEVNSEGVESDMALSLPKFLGVVGITPGFTKDNPSSNNHNYGFSAAGRGWARLASSASGAVVTSSVEYYEDNFIIDRTVDGGNVTSELIYRASDPVGAYAKMITYTGPFSVDGKASKVVYTDSVKPA